jgi:phosphoribosylaminoimidazole-succinocarboxamide synthase
VTATLVRVDAPGLTVFRRGKVRDTFELSDGTLLMVATDRISAFDVVLPTPIPDKGRVLTQMSLWWFDKSRPIVPNHIIEDPASLPADARQLWEEMGPRNMHVRRAERIDIECVVRGYLAGSGWKEYHERGTLADEPLPAGLQESSRLPEHRFTPAMKNDSGHDENISRERLASILGTELARQLEAVSLALFNLGVRHCEERGMILVDTKFEFGVIDGRLTLIDEVFTPDSSRFWDAAQWAPGKSMPSFDKQPVRDWLEATHWDKIPPAPELPADVLAATRERYIEAARRICGLELG